MAGDLSSNPPGATTNSIITAIPLSFELYLFNEMLPADPNPDKCNARYGAGYFTCPRVPPGQHGSGKRFKSRPCRGDGRRNSVLANLEVHLTILEPGKAAHPPHTHTDQEELMIIREGLLKVTIAGKSKILAAGSVAYALPGDEHAAINAGKGKAAYYIVKYKTRKPVMNEQGAAAGGSILMNWFEVPFAVTDRGKRKSFFNRPTSLFSNLICT